jgi:hypothetical protein
MILMILAAQQDHSINSGQVVYPMWAECPMLTRMVIVGALSYADPKLGTKAKVEKQPPNFVVAPCRTFQKG